MGKRTVTVTGTGRANVAPDVVRLDLRVGHDAPDVAAALSGASAGITAVGRRRARAGCRRRRHPHARRQRQPALGQHRGGGRLHGAAAARRHRARARRGRAASSSPPPRRSATRCSSTRCASTSRTAREGLRRGPRRRLRRRQVQGGAVCRPRRRVAGRGARGGGGRRAPVRRRVQARWRWPATWPAGMPVEGGDLELSDERHGDVGARASLRRGHGITRVGIAAVGQPLGETWLPLT